jgi:hypothetical protein
LTRPGCSRISRLFFDRFSSFLEYKMFEENLALLRIHHKNIQRYHQLLKTSLTDFEREYIGKRLLEEQSAVEMLSAKAPSVASIP